MRIGILETVALVVLIGIFVLPHLTLAPEKDASPTTSTATSSPFVFEILNTPEERTLGLSGRESISENEAILFVFPTASKYSFWMKDMKFNIDILWLADTGDVLGIEKNVSPDTYPKSFTPPVPVRKVLEIKAGQSDVRELQVGSTIKLPPL